MSMKWTKAKPTEGGFYYWQNEDLWRISPDAVRVVQVSKYKYREGFACHTLTCNGETSPPVFDCDLREAPPGKWAGPLPQPYYGS